MSKLLHDGRHLLYSTAIATKIGRNEAICLQQIHYWLGVSGGKVVDGTKWFWKTYRQWSEELLLSVSTVRRVVNNLKKLGLIAIARLAAKTYYQANWYTLNYEAIEVLIQNEHIDAIALDKSTCSKRADDIKDFPPQEFSSKKQAAELENCLEPDWDTAKLKALAWEQEQLNRLEGAQDQSTPTPVVDEKSFSTADVNAESSQNLSTIVSDRTTTPPVNESSQNLSTLASDRVTNPSADESLKIVPNIVVSFSTADVSTKDESNQNSSTMVSFSTAVRLKNESVFCDRTTLPPADKSITNSPCNELTNHRDASPVPADEHEEENIKICEVRDAVGKLTPNLKKLIGEFTLGDLRKALVLYRQRQQKQHIRDAYSWLRKCLEQRWWQDKSARTQSVAVPESVAAKDKLTQEQKEWYARAIASGICLQASIEELPTKMGRICARVSIPNPRPYDSPFELFAIEDLMVEYPL